MTFVSTRASYDRFNLDMGRLRGEADALRRAIASGERLERGSQDPVAAARLRSLASSQASAEVDQANAQRASADLTLADKALDGFAERIMRVKELAAQAANGTLNPQQRVGISAEIKQIFSELVSLANASDSSGHALFGGQGTGPAYVLDAAGNAIYAGTASAAELSLGEVQGVTRGVTGPDFLKFTVAGAPTTLLAVVKGLGEALGGAVADPAQAARDALTALDVGLEAVTTQQTVIGARLNWIELSSDRLVHKSELRAEEQEAVGGTDLTQAVSRLQQTMTVLEATQASFARLSSLSLFSFLR